VSWELREKESRLWPWLRGQGLDGVLISRRSNFAWITAGGDNHVFLASEVGAAALLVLEEGKYLLAHTMDGERILAEEIAGQDVTPCIYQWYEGRQATLDALTRGRRIGSDVALPGLVTLDGSWRDLIFPLTPLEIERARANGRLADEAMRQVCQAVRPGDSELVVAGLLAQAYTERGLLADVLLVGADERPYAYRHCLPTGKRIEKYVLMHVAAQRHGLHCNVTRLVHFGPVPDDLRRRHRAVSHVHATILMHLRPGRPFAELLEPIKAAYAAHGHDDEWRGHIQGGSAAYEACEPMLLLDPLAAMTVNETYDWLPTVPGTKSEELSLLTAEGTELLSLGPGWPTVAIPIGDHTFQMPDILEL
jgi:antitoxin VapB